MSGGCRERFEALSALADGELRGGERAGLERHLSGCPGCRAAVRALAAARAATAAADRAAPRGLPPGLDAALASRARAFLAAGRPRAAAAAAAALAGLALCAGAAALLARGRATPLADAIVDDHARYYPAQDPAEIASAEPAVVERWLGARLPFAIEVPTLPDARLIGGRRCTVAGERVGLLFYERDGGRLSLFVLRDPDGQAAERLATGGSAPAGACAPRLRGYGLCVRRRGGRSFALAGESDTGELRALLAGALRGDAR